MKFLTIFVLLFSMPAFAESSVKKVDYKCTTCSYLSEEKCNELGVRILINLDNRNIIAQYLDKDNKPYFSIEISPGDNNEETQCSVIDKKNWSCKSTSYIEPIKQVSTWESMGNRLEHKTLFISGRLEDDPFKILKDMNCNAVGILENVLP